MVEVGILNVTGYAGLSLALLLQRHPEFKLVAVSGRGDAGKPLSAVFPFWAGAELAIEERLPALPLVFCALPHGAAAAQVAPLVRAGARAVDISADFRLHDQALYEHWYGEHAAPELLPQAVYGLPEVHGDQVRGATLVANPGCYPTAAILALAPALREGLIEPDVIVDAKSGVSGSGRGLSLGTHFGEVNESVHAYGIGGHRHLPEIEQELTGLAGGAVRAVFIPHLIPMTRGLLATCYARVRRPVTAPELTEIYRSFYAEQPFTRVVATSPATKWTSGTNDCLVYPGLSADGSHLVGVAAIDNLVKGAAGQAIQNANLMYGLPEDSGLALAPAYP